jgi:hypothetical protein
VRGGARVQLNAPSDDDEVDEDGGGGGAQGRLVSVSTPMVDEWVPPSPYTHALRLLAAARARFTRSMMCRATRSDSGAIITAPTLRYTLLLLYGVFSMSIGARQLAN